MSEVVDQTQPVTGGVKRLSFRVNFSWMLVGNAIYAACQWGVVSAIAKLGTPDMVGTFALGLAIASPVFILSNLHLNALQATDAVDQFDFSDYLGLRLIATGAGLLAVIAIGVIVDLPIEAFWVLVAVAFAKSIEGVSDLIYGKCQQQEAMDRVAKSLLTRGPLTLLVMVGVLATTNSILLTTASMAATWAAVLLSIDLPSIRKVAANLRPRVDPKALSSLTKLAAPVGIAMMLGSLGANIPRYYLQAFWSEQAVGFYSAIAYLLVAGRTAVNAITQAASPRLAAEFSEGNILGFKRTIQRIALIVALLGSAGVVVCAIGGGLLLEYLYTEEYAAYAAELNVVMLAAAVAYLASLMCNGMTAVRQLRAQFPLFVLVVATSALVGMFMIPRWGVMGAALTFLTGALVQLTGAALIVGNALSGKEIESGTN